MVLDVLKEFSREELDATVALSCDKRFSTGDDLTMQRAVRLVAKVGGYVLHGPPG